MSDSNFQIVDIGSVAASDRGIRQEIAPIANGKIRTKLSGRSYSTARPQLQKFRTTVYFDDLWPPAFGGLWIGQVVTINCAVPLPQPQAVGSAPIRDQVAGTLVHYDANMAPVAADSPDARWFNYCPVLTCLVESWNISEDEWGAAASSDITFSEVAPAGWVAPDAG